MGLLSWITVHACVHVHVCYVCFHMDSLISKTEHLLELHLHTIHIWKKKPSKVHFWKQTPELAIMVLFTNGLILSQGKKQLFLFSNHGTRKCALSDKLLAPSTALHVRNVFLCCSIYSSLVLASTIVLATDTCYIWYTCLGAIVKIAGQFVTAISSGTHFLQV